jgi:hypothetical protein
MSSPLLVAIGIFISIGLVHFAYIDFRFRHRDGIAWFWLGGPAPPLLWASRAAVALALLAALSIKFLGPSRTLAFVIVGLMLFHIVTLIILEIRESR